MTRLPNSADRDAAAAARLRSAARDRPPEEPMPEFLTLDDIDVRGKRVLLRADLNVPVKDGRVTDVDPHRASGPDHRGVAREGRHGRRDVAFRTPRQPARPGVVAAPAVGPAAAGAGRARSRVRHRLHRRAGTAGCRRAPAGAGGAPRKSSLSSGRGGKFHRFCASPGRAWARSMSTTPFRQHIARMPRLPRSRICCRPPPAG